jgi:hypothetical protein
VVKVVKVVKTVKSLKMAKLMVKAVIAKKLPQSESK